MLQPDPIHKPENPSSTIPSSSETKSSLFAEAFGKSTGVSTVQTGVATFPRLHVRKKAQPGKHGCHNLLPHYSHSQTSQEYCLPVEKQRLQDLVTYSFLRLSKL